MLTLFLLMQHPTRLPAVPTQLPAIPIVRTHVAVPKQHVATRNTLVTRILRTADPEMQMPTCDGIMIEMIAGAMILDGTAMLIAVSVRVLTKGKPGASATGTTNTIVH